LSNSAEWNTPHEKKQQSINTFAAAHHFHFDSLSPLSATGPVGDFNCNYLLFLLPRVIPSSLGCSLSEHGLAHPISLRLPDFLPASSAHHTSTQSINHPNQINQIVEFFLSIKSIHAFRKLK
jgi:hypothetical protein